MGTAVWRTCGKPGSFRWTLAPGQTVHLACSMEPLELSAFCTDLSRARRNSDWHTAIVRSEVDEELETLLKAADAFVVSSPAEPPDQGDGECDIAAIPLVVSPAGGRP